jgi:hypothetical protein
MGLILLRISKQPDDLAFTPATGRRLYWAQLPDRVRRELETRVGSAVTEAITQPGGFSPGVAARLRLANGRSVFLKAVSASINPDSPGMHRREARIAAALPSSIPAPRLLDSYDDGDWIALIFEAVDGAPPVMPWRPQELDRVLAAVTELTALLTPAPIAVEPVSELMPDVFTGWRRLAAADGFEGLDPWIGRHLAELMALETAATGAADGATLLHADIRADNILLTATDVIFVDWPWASRGAAWIDLAFMLPSVAMQRGPMPWEIFEKHPLGNGVPDERVTAVVAALAGFFTRQSRQPSPPGLPTVRAFQRDQGRPALEWLKRRTGWT